MFIIYKYLQSVTYSGTEIYGMARKMANLINGESSPPGKQALEIFIVDGKHIITPATEPVMVLKNLSLKISIVCCSILCITCFPDMSELQ